jgi:hypothetical protein
MRRSNRTLRFLIFRKIAYIMSTLVPSKFYLPLSLIGTSPAQILTVQPANMECENKKLHERYNKQ